MDAQQDAGGIIGVHLCLCREVAAVDQAEAHDFSLCFVCGGTF